MGARFEGDEDIGSPCLLPCLPQGVNLRMGSASLLMPSLSDNDAPLDDDAAHRRIGSRPADTSSGKG